jgi:hypothetical protein
LAKQFQRRRFLEIDKSETSIAYGGRGFKVFYNRRYVLNFRRYLKKIGRGSEGLSRYRAKPGGGS